MTVQAITFTMTSISVYLFCYFLFNFSFTFVEGRKKRQAINVAELDVTIVKSIDKEARKQLLFLIANRLNDTVSTQSVFAGNCQNRLNSTIDGCSTCKTDLCANVKIPSLSEEVVSKISIGNYRPVTYAGEVMKEIAQWAVGAKDFFGYRLGPFLENIGEDLIKVAKVLIKGGKYIASPAADAFRSLGGSIAKAGREIIQAISGDVNNIIGNLKGLIGKPFDDFENALKTVGQIVSEKAPVVINAIKDAVLPVWERTLGTLFRRKRCVSSCLSCDKLDAKKYTISWIIESVCGSDTARQKNKAMAEITFLKDMYTKIKDKELITKIEYDLSSNAWSGLMIYMDTFASIGGKLVQQITGDLNISAPVRTGWSIAQQIFDAELDNRQSSTTFW
ncbi:uncharacterized protein LOC143046951 [Mytilus galloprovincialis]|uniref:uncharacterized protein LOC143046951 n=1 Tax=Mytilus galloprovincialis TaxID=29158 RepID=UPI003F7C84E7